MKNRGGKSWRNGVEVDSVFRHLFYSNTPHPTHTLTLLPPPSLNVEDPCPQPHLEVGGSVDLCKGMVKCEERNSFFHFVHDFLLSLKGLLPPPLEKG